MSDTLAILLIIYSLIWFFIILSNVRKEKISVRYSMVWLVMSLIIFLVGITPDFMEYVAECFGFLTTSNLVIGIILTILMLITLILTIIVTKQKKQIKTLIQEVSIIKEKVNK